MLQLCCDKLLIRQEKDNEKIWESSSSIIEGNRLGSLSKQRKRQKNEGKKVEQTTKTTKRKKKIKTAETSESPLSDTAAVTQSKVQQPNQVTPNTSTPAYNQAAGNTATPTGNAPTQPVPAVTDPVAPADQSLAGVYSREECVHIARMTISMSGADESQFTEEQLYNYYDRCAQLVGDYSYLLGLVAHTVLDKYMN